MRFSIRETCPLPIVERTLEILRQRQAERGSRGPAPKAFTRHDLRRSVATGMVRIGVPLATVSRVLGHSTATQSRLGGDAQVTADVYVRDRQVRDSLAALQAWSLHIAGVTGGVGGAARLLPFVR